ncbi:MAG TPA: branched-chain amino acid ABC transporter permease [Gaiellaceae bacterium]|jgi:branched-chain amino acid transport system permease protein
MAEAQVQEAPRPVTDRLGIERGTLVRAVVIAVLLACALILVPALTGAYWLTVATGVTIYAVVALGAGLLYGRVGLVSLCQIALLAVGAWVAARISYGTSIPFPLVLLIAGAVTAAIAVVIGLPVLRLQGLYLALITLMAAGATSIVLHVIHFPNGGGGFTGVTSDALAIRTIRRPDIATSDTAFYRYAVVVMAVMLLIALIHVSTKPGRAWAAIRESEAAAVAAGVHITLYKLWAFGLAAFFAGVAGGVMGASAGQLSVGPFATQESIILLAATLMGGIFSLWGAVVAGLLLQLLPALLQDWGLPSELLIILFGVGILQVLLTAPAGLVAQVPKDLANLGRLIAKPFRGRGSEAKA